MKPSGPVFIDVFKDFTQKGGSI